MSGRPALYRNDSGTMSRPGCPQCLSTHVTSQGRGRFLCKDCGRRFSASTAHGAPVHRYPTKQCPRCGPAPHIKAGKTNGKARWRCKSCGLKHTPEQRQRSRALENHQTPPCPRCQNPTPDRNGIDYRYEKQAYLCRACGKTFRVQLARFAPVHVMDAILDRCLREAVGAAEQLEQAGAFTRFGPRNRAKQVLAAKLAAELYMARIGEASHATFDEALAVTIAATNRYLADVRSKTPRGAQSRLTTGIAFAALDRSMASIPLQPTYELDKTKAAASLQRPENEDAPQSGVL